MKALQQKYKGDRQKQNEELMKFYKENNINPAASCLPMVAQFPIFIALYFVLRSFAKHPPGRRSLAGSASCRRSPPRPRSHWTGYVLLVVYAASQVASTLLMSTTMDKMQRNLLLVLPLAFIFIVARFPTGLVIYWMTTNLWTVGPGPRHPPARAANRRRAREALVAHAGEGRPRRPAIAAGADGRQAPPPRPSRPRRPSRSRRRGRCGARSAPARR